MRGRGQIRQSDGGVGFIMIHTAGEMVEEIEFFLDARGFLRRTSNGGLLVPL